MTIVAKTASSGPHLHGVRTIPGVNDVEWSATKEVRIEMKTAAVDRGLLVVTGPVGVGKSFAVTRGAQACNNSVDQVIWLELSSTIRGRALLASLYPDLAGGNAPKGDTETQLMAGLHLAASSMWRLIIVDEAQHITLQAMHALRGLHSDLDADFGLVLVGTPRLLDRIPPEIRSRQTGEVKIDRLTNDEAPAVLAAYHSRFATVDPALLAEVNKRLAGGEFRWWAKMLVRLNRYVPADAGMSMADFRKWSKGL